MTWWSPLTTDRWSETLIFCILCLCSFWLGSRHRPDDVAVSRVGDGEGADPEVLAARSAQLVVVAGVVVDTSLGQHGIVLDLRLAEWGCVVGNDHQLGLSTPQGFQGLLVAEHVLARLHNQGKPRVDRLVGLLNFLLGTHFAQV